MGLSPARECAEGSARYSEDVAALEAVRVGFERLHKIRVRRHSDQPVLRPRRATFDPNLLNHYT